MAEQPKNSRFEAGPKGQARPKVKVRPPTTAPAQIMHPEMATRNKEGAKHMTKMRKAGKSNRFGC